MNQLTHGKKEDYITNNMPKKKRKSFMRLSLKKKMM